MNPISLRLQNFTSYIDETVDLSDLRIVGLFGPNGSGKSSLIEAIVWAIYGEASKGGRRSSDNYVRIGASSCSVELVFKLSGKKYTIHRIWDKVKSQTLLKLMEEEQGRWVDISLSSVTDTQNQIASMFGMGYDAFIATVIALQGKSDAFAGDVVTDQDRKEILSALLSLDIWEKAHDKISKWISEKSVEIEEKKLKLSSLELQLAEIDSLQGKYDEASAEIAKLKSLSIEKSKNRDLLLGIVEELDAIEQQLADAKQKLATLEIYRTESLGALDAQIRNLDEAIDSYHRSNSELMKYVEQQREKITDVDESIDYNTLISQLESKLEYLSEKKALKTEVERKYNETMLESQRWIISRNNEFERLQNVLDNIENMKATVSTVPCSDAMKSACPVVSSLVQEIDNADTLVSAYNKALAQSNPYESTLETLQTELNEINQYEQQYEEVWHELVQAQRNSNIARENKMIREAIDKANAEIHKQNTAALKAEQDRKRLADDHSEKSTDISEQTEILKLHVDKLERELDANKSVMDELALINNELRDLDKAIAGQTALQKYIAGMVGNRGALQQEIDAIKSEIDSFERSLAATKIAQRACSKRDGVPAFLIENAVPEIEALANDVLERLSKGRLAVKLETQSETKSGTVREVLKTVIFDGGHSRPYKTFSGAERFMVDMAIRVGMGKFLARRVGIKMETFVIDEGLSCLDDANREEIVGTIFSVAKDFEKVFVVTHITEVEEFFPERMYFRKTSAGSKVNILRVGR